MKNALLTGAGLVTLAVAAVPAAAQTTDNWTGGYIGGRIGYASTAGGNNETTVFDLDLDGNFDDTVTTGGATGPNAFSPGFCDGSATSSAPGTGCEEDDDGFDAAIFAGYDWQGADSPLVLGLVAEVGTSKAEDSVSSFSTTPASYTLERKVKFDATLRARAGYSLGRSLLYVTGGGTYARIRNRFFTSNTANGFTDSGNSDGYGFKVGGGAEHRISDNFSVGLLYLFSSLRDEDYAVRAGRNAAGTTPAANPFIRVQSAGTDIGRSDRTFNQHSISLSGSFRF